MGTTIGPACEVAVLKWAIIFFIISLVAGFLGFSGLSSAAATVAKILFAIFLAICLVFLALALAAGQLLL